MENPPSLTNQDGVVAMWAPPDLIEDLSDSELEEAIWQSARIYGHFAKIAEAANGLLKVIKEEVDTLGVVIYDQFYPGMPKSEIKATLAADADYRRAESLKKRLTIIHATAEGNRKDWSKLSDRLSRIVELRKELPKNNPGRRVKRTPKNPKQIFRREDT
jgi:hypothetical protein